MTDHTYTHRIAITADGGMLVAAAERGTFQNMLLVRDISDAGLEIGDHLFPIRLFDVDMFDGSPDDEDNLKHINGDVVYRGSSLGNLPYKADFAAGEFVKEIEDFSGIEDFHHYVDDHDGDMLDLGTSTGCLADAISTLTTDADTASMDFETMRWDEAEMVIKCADIEVFRQEVAARIAA